MPKVFLINDTSQEGHHGCTLVMRHLNRLLSEHRIQRTGRVRSGRYAKDYHPQAAREADVILVNGEGTLHHNGPQVHALFDCLQKAARESGAPVWVLNTLLQELSPPHYDLLRSCAQVVCRESASLSDARAHGIHQAVLCPDLTFLRNGEADSAENPSSDVLVTDSVDRDVTLGLYAASRQMRARFLPFLAQGPSAFRQTAHRCFHLLHRMGLPVRTDRWVRGCTENLSDCLRKIRGARTMVSGRFHATCLGLRYGIPTLSVAHPVHKIRGLLQDVGMQELEIPFSALQDSQQLHREIKKLERQRVEVVEKSRNYAVAADREIRSVYGRLFSSLNRP